MVSVNGPKTEEEWQAEHDARTLVEAELIKQDEERVEKARIAAAKIVDRERKEARAMQKVATQKPNQKPKSGGVKQTSGNTSSINTHNVFRRIST